MVYQADIYDFTEELSITKNPIPKKVYKYINLKTKKIDSIEFTDYQRAFEEKYLLWFSAKGTKMIHKFLFYDHSMLRNVGRGELETQKYLQIMEEMNKMWVVYGEKTYESFNWIRKFYSSINWTGPFNLKNLGRNSSEGFRRMLFSAEKKPKRKLIYTTLEYWKKLFWSRGIHTYVMKTPPGAKYFVSRTIYDNRS